MCDRSCCVEKHFKLASAYTHCLISFSTVMCSILCALSVLVALRVLLSFFKREWKWTMLPSFLIDCAIVLSSKIESVLLIVVLNWSANRAYCTPSFVFSSFPRLLFEFLSYLPYFLNVRFCFDITVYIFEKSASREKCTVSCCLRWNHFPLINHSSSSKLNSEISRKKFFPLLSFLISDKFSGNFTRNLQAPVFSCVKIFCCCYWRLFLAPIACKCEIFCFTEMSACKYKDVSRALFLLVQYEWGYMCFS